MPLTQPKVSVIVPVYNPGKYLRRCTDSIVGQSLPQDEFEAIFVDDGSTDESPAELDALAVAHPNIRVIHQPNSGWPGKPRNVGIDAARGKYLYFVDHDDVLGSEALERMYAFAERNGSDIVIGKMAGHGRGIPRMLFLETRDRVTVDDAPIMSSLSPHKMFRKGFLDETGIRFPEGRRRLEDHVFVATAYFAASVISILADYTCYYHLAREDRGNAGRGAYDPAGSFDPAWYYRFLREVLEVVETHTEPGPARDRLLRRFTQRELLSRFTTHRFLVSSPEGRRVLLGEVRSVVDRYIPDTVDPTLPAQVRTKLALVRADRLDLLVALAESDLAMDLAVRFHGLRHLDGRRVLLDVEAELVNDGRPVRFEAADGALLLPVPVAVAAAVDPGTRLIPVSAEGEALIVLHRRRDSAEVVLRPTVRRTRTEDGGHIRLISELQVEIDPDVGIEGSALQSGRWDILTRILFAGYRFDTPVRRSAGFGRTRPLLFVDGAPAMGRARWQGPRPLRSRRLPGVVWTAAASPAGRRVLRMLHRPIGP